MKKRYLSTANFEILNLKKYQFLKKVNKDTIFKFCKDLINNIEAFAVE